jgi:hypothetical protein
LVSQQVAHFIYSLEQALLCKRVDWESNRRSVLHCQSLGLEVYRDVCRRILRRQAEQRGVSIPVDNDRKEPVLKAIAAEDIGK